MKRFIGILLAVCLVITMLPTAFAEETYVAQIGNVQYTTLSEAISVATDGAEIDLIANTEEYVTFSGNKSATLDLNGFEITSDVDTIKVTNGFDLTIKDSSVDETGKIITTSTDPNGSAYGAIEVEYSSKLTLENGTISAPDYGIFAYESAASIIINGGLVEATGEENYAYALYTRCHSEIKGGTFTSTEHWVVYGADGMLTVTGGTFSTDVVREHYRDANNYGIRKNEDGTYTVYKLEKNIFIGGTGYLTLAAAFAEAKENDTITITKAGEYVWPTTAIPAGVTVKGEEDGIVATSDGTTKINATTLTVENIDFSAINHAAQVTNGKATALTFTNCSFTGVYAFHVDYAKNAELTFNNCVFNGFTTFATTVASIDVNGGEINGDFIARQDTTIDDVTFSEDAAVQLGTKDTVSNVNVTITDCTVADTNEDGITRSVADLVIKTNNANSDNFVVVDGNTVIDGSVNASHVAQVGTVYYTDLKEAIDAADNNDEAIKLLNNIKLKEDNIAIKDLANVDFNGYRITKANGDIIYQKADGSVAVYTPYDIVFDANGGVCKVSYMTANESGKLASLPEATRDGYKFLGWFTAKVDGKAITVDTVYTADTIVYAQWEEIPVEEEEETKLPVYMLQLTADDSKTLSSGLVSALNAASTRYMLIAEASEGGRITPAGARSCIHGSQLHYSFFPAEGYEVAEVYIDGEPIGACTAIVVKGINCDMEIYVEFQKIA